MHCLLMKMCIQWQKLTTVVGLWFLNISNVTISFQTEIVYFLLLFNQIRYIFAAA